MDKAYEADDKKYWSDCIAQYNKDAQKWVDRSKKIVKRYKDERKDENATTVRYNILWSNIQTLKPALYAKDPHPEVERRFKDDDDVGRVASDVLERCLSYSISNHQFGDIMRECVLDKLLVGRGIAWVRYVPSFKDAEPDMITDDVDSEEAGEDTDEKEPLPQVIDFEDIAYDFVYFEDFGYSKSRTWEEVQAVWRRVYLSRDELVERFGEEIGNAVPLDHKADDAPDDTTQKKATIYEIWDKCEKEAIWLSLQYPELLDVRKDPLGLEGFFPCPKPMFGTIANDSTIPVPDYALYQDQAIELDELTKRIAMITKAIKVAGVYDASAKDIDRLMSDGVTNTLIPVDNWAMFAEKGGIAGAVSLLPMGEIAQTLMQLYEVRDKVKQDLYEISGMSDIIRGASDPNETATAQQIKSNYASVRLNDQQRDVQRFARDLLRIAGQIIASHFQLDTIKQICGVRLLTEQEKQFMQAAMQNPQVAQQIPQEQLNLLNEPSWEQVEALLKDDNKRNFRIDIETDSTIMQDAQQEQQARLEFVNTIGQVMQGAATIAQTTPQLLEPIKESIMFLIRGYKVGRTTESAFKTALEKMSGLANQPPPQQGEQDSKGDMLQVEQVKQQGAAQNEQLKQQGAAQLEQTRHMNRMNEIAVQHQNAKELELIRAQASGQNAALADERHRDIASQQLAQEHQHDTFKMIHDAAQRDADRNAKALQQSAKASEAP